MLDVQFIREHRDAVEANCKNRNVTCDVGRVLELDDQRRHLVQAAQQKQQRANEVSKLIPKEKDQAQKQGLIKEGRELREAVTGIEAQLKQAEADLRAALSNIPNMTHPDAPVGGTPEDNK